MCGVITPQDAKRGQQATLSDVPAPYAVRERAANREIASVCEIARLAVEQSVDGASATQWVRTAPSVIPGATGALADENDRGAATTQSSATRLQRELAIVSIAPAADGR
jgi:hypothetical protein